MGGVRIGHRGRTARGKASFASSTQRVWEVPTKITIGAHRSEMCARRWHHVDLDKALLTIRRTVKSATERMGPVVQVSEPNPGIATVVVKHDQRLSECMVFLPVAMRPTLFGWAALKAAAPAAASVLVTAMH